MQAFTTIAALALVSVLMFSERIIHEGHALAFIILAGAVLAVHVRSWPLRLLALYMAGSVAVEFALVLHGAQPMRLAMDALGKLWFAMCGLIFYLAVARSRARTTTLVNGICAIALFQAALGLSQLVGFDPWMWAYNQWTHIPCVSYLTASEATAIGSLGNPNFLAAYLAFCLPFFYRRGWMYGAIPIVALLLLSRTSTAIVAAGVGAAVCFYDRKHLKYYLPIVIIGAVGVAVFLDRDWNSIWRSERWALWIVGTEGILRDGWHSILLGNGLGAKTGVPYPLHNDWMELWFSLGAAGVGLALGWLFSMLRVPNRMLRASVATIAVNAIGNYPFLLAPSGALIMCLCGLVERERMQA